MITELKADLSKLINREAYRENKDRQKLLKRGERSGNPAKRDAAKHGLWTQLRGPAS